MRITEVPEKWMVLKLVTGYYKIFATWSDRWKINSGIMDIKEDDTFYYFIGYSESCYKCHKDRYGVTDFYGSNVLSDILDRYGNNIEPMDHGNAKQYINNF